MLCYLIPAENMDYSTAGYLLAMAKGQDSSLFLLDSVCKLIIKSLRISVITTCVLAVAGFGLPLGCEGLV